MKIFTKHYPDQTSLISCLWQIVINTYNGSKSSCWRISSLDLGVIIRWWRCHTLGLSGCHIDL